MRAELIGDALKQALVSPDTVPDLIFHSDRGSQYGSGAYHNNNRKHSAFGYQTPAQFEPKIHSLN